MEIFGGAPHHDILSFLVRVVILLVTARLLGELARRLGYPVVVGEILAGVLLGPSLLSGLFPAVAHWVLPQNPVQGYLLELFGLLGALLLLIITGLEIDLPLIRRHARTALGIAAGGLILPFSSGIALATLLPDDLVGDPSQRVVFVLFIATAMSITAIPVLAKVLIDLKLMRRDIGQTIMAVGMVDDTVAWIMLSIVLGLAGGAALTFFGVLGAVGKIALFMVLSFTAGRWLIAKALDLVQDRMTLPDRLLSLVVVTALTWGAVAQAIGIEAVLGAFVVGVLFGTMRRLPEQVIERLHSVTMAVFAPVFFGVAGLKVNLPSLFSPRLLFITLMVILVACFGKILGPYLVGRWQGLGHWRSLAFGAALNARGAVEIIIATIGLAAGILTQDMYSIIVVMAVATSIMAPIMLRGIIPHLEPDAVEEARLRRESLAAQSRIAHLRRVLLPMRLRLDIEAAGGADHRLERLLLERLGGVPATLMTVTRPGDRSKGMAFLQRVAEGFEQRQLTKRVVESLQPIEAIVDEAEKDYDLIVLGATERNGGSRDVIFSPLVDYVVRMAEMPTVIVKGRERAGAWPPKRVLVPSNGSWSSRQAAELAFLVAGREGEQVVLLQVLERGIDSHRFDGGEVHARQLANARNSLETLQQLGRSVGTEADILIEEADAPERAILEVAARLGVDLIVLGTDVRTGTDRLFLGPRVERILEEAPCPVLVMNAGGGSAAG